jgi:predicted kinase
MTATAAAAAAAEAGQVAILDATNSTQERRDKVCQRSQCNALHNVACTRVQNTLENMHLHA